MGNQNKGASKLAIGAMAHVVHFDRDKLAALQKEFARLAAESPESKYAITSDQFESALKLVGIIEKDKEILDRLFIMFDEAGDKLINFREFVVGIAMLVNGTVEEKLHFAFKLFDLDDSGRVAKDDMLRVLSSMNRTASYFGDCQLTEAALKELVEEILQSCDTDHTEQLSYAQFMKAVAEHPSIVDFINQKPDSEALVKLV